MSSRFVNTHRDVSYSNGTVSLHSHQYIEILYCRTSVGVEYLIGSNRYRLQKGDIVFVPPGVSHRPILPEKLTAPYERDVLWVRGLPGALAPESSGSLIAQVITQWIKEK